MTLNQIHKTLLVALRKTKRSITRGALTAAAAGTGLGSPGQFDIALSELAAKGKVKIIDGWVLPIEEE